MPFYGCIIKNSDSKEIVWKIAARSLENAKRKFALIKHLDTDEYNRLFDTEEILINDDRK
jgi:hypothetical protein